MLDTAIRDAPTCDTDLVVVGAGAAGMTAALAAARHGLRVELHEASEYVGGTTAASAGTRWIPGNRQAAEAGHDDSAARAGEYLEALLGEADPRGLRRAYLAEAARTVAEIERHTRVRFVSAGIHPDYVQAPGAAVAGRAISPMMFDARVLSAEDFRRVRPPPPEFLVLGGMMVNKADVQALFNRWRSARAFARTVGLTACYLRDRLLGFPRGTRLVLGNALVARLLASLRDAGVELRFGHRLTSLERRGGAVSAAVFAQAGSSVRRSATHGVVLATGGIGHDPILRAALGAGHAPRFNLACESVCGQGIAAAQSVGGAFERHRNDFLWQPVSQVPRPDGSIGLFPHLYLDRAKPGLIAVGRDGRRFVDEGSSYHHFVEAQCRRFGADEPAWLVCDSAFVHRYGLGIVPPGRMPARHTAGGYVESAPTLGLLAERVGIDAAGLADTVARHNEFALRGDDADFGKGHSPLARFNGDPAHQPSPCLAAISQPPFHALAVWAADAASSSGLATDAEGAVLDEAGRVVPGLYACGNDMASALQGAYPGPGATLGPALVFGWRAGVRAASVSKAERAA